MTRYLTLILRKRISETLTASLITVLLPSRVKSLSSSMSVFAILGKVFVMWNFWIFYQRHPMWWIVPPIIGVGIKIPLANKKYDLC